MPTSVSLGRHYDKFVKEQLSDGQYNSVSEIIRAGLRLLEEQARLAKIREQELAKALQEGIDSPDAGDLDEVMARVMSRFKSKKAKSGRR